MKTTTSLLLTLFFASSLMAQAPLGFNYQGIAREADGTPISGKEIAIRVSIIDGPQGNSEFSEEHFLVTNDFGLFTAIIGQGNGNSTLSSVDWSLGNLWLQVELDADNSGYILMGSQQLMSVPYALFAQQSGEGLTPGYGIDVNDGTISNVLPDRPISLTGVGDIEVKGTYPTFTIENIGTVDDDFDATNEIQSLTKSGNTVTLSNGGGNFTDEVDDADSDVTNEIQGLSLNANNLELTSGGSVDLSGYMDNTDSQNLANVLGENNSAGSSKIVDLANPTLAQDATTKSYVDTQDTGLQSAINSEVTNRTDADAGIQLELNATQVGGGLDTGGGYTADATTSYLQTASDLKDADKKLDVQIQSNSMGISTLTSRLDNTYAFQASFIVNESEVGGVSQKQVTLIENLDSFNQIASNEVVIGASGLYLILVDSERDGTESTLTNLQIRVSSTTDTDYTIYVSGLDQNVGRTLMLNLTFEDIITLLVTTSNPQNEPLSGVLGGYKIAD